MEGQKLNGTERAVFGLSAVDEVAEVLDGYLVQHLGAGISQVLFRAGRIDAVWAVRTDDGRQVVVKAHRRPVDLTARAATVTAQRMLWAAGFPCPEPLRGPDVSGALVLSVETLLSVGTAADGRDPVVRRAMADGLAEHVAILRSRPELTLLAGEGPAWCRYQSGPWPVPHDPIFDFRVTPDGFGWLDDLAGEAAGRLRSAANDGERVVGHADWYGGNLRFDAGRLVAAYDWDLVADSEAVLAGLSAAAYTDSGLPEADLPSPDEVAAFLVDYDTAMPAAFDGRQQRTCAAAVAWVLAYNARCQLSMLDGEPAAGSPLEIARRSGRAYLDLRW